MLRRQDLYCEACEREGHIEAVCITNRIKNSYELRPSSANLFSTAIHDYEPEYTQGVNYEKHSGKASSYNIVDLFEIVPDSDKYMVIIYTIVNINNKMKKIEVDSGSQ